MNDFTAYLTLVIPLCAGIAVCLGYCLVSWVNEKTQPPRVEVLPALIERPEPELVPEPDELTPVEMLSMKLDAQFSAITTLIEFQESKKIASPDLMAHPIGNGDTIGAAMDRRLYALITKIMEGEADDTVQSPSASAPQKKSRRNAANDSYRAS